MNQTFNIELNDNLVNQLNNIAEKTGHAINELLIQLIQTGITNNEDPLIFSVRRSEIIFQFEEIKERTPTEKEINDILDHINGLEESLSELTYPLLEDEISVAIEDLEIE